jgi:hypothetical protein
VVLNRPLEDFDEMFQLNEATRLKLSAKFMEIFKENLDGIPILTVSSRKDNLPFRICVKIGGQEPRHAIITDLETGKKILGKFLFSTDYPEGAESIEKYEQDISHDMQTAIYEWAYDCSTRFDMLINNWEAINTVWYTFNVLPYSKW